VYSLSGQLLYERINSAYRQNYYLGSQLIAHQGAGEQTFIHPDILGTTAGKTNSDGGLIKRLRYAPFGLEWGKTNASSGEDEIGYTGHKHDKSIGLTYMQARYYDPVIGRFYFNDPVDAVSHLSNEEGIKGFNRYSYAVNNPYKYTDPDGKAICGGVCVGAVAVGIGRLSVAAYRAYKTYRAGVAGGVATAVVLNEVAENDNDGQSDSEGKTVPHSSEEKALQDMLTGDTRRGNRLSNDDADAYIDLADEMGNETSDHRGENGRQAGGTENHWQGGAHIHIERMRSGTKDKHIPTEQPEQKDN